MRRTSSAWALIALVVALALGGVIERATRSVWAQDGASDNGYQIDSGRYVVVGVILYDKQELREVYVYNASGYPTATPSAPVATETPGPSPTASATPTSAPAPTLTPTPTPLPTATSTPVATVQPTPTQEQKCWGTVTANPRLNVRAAASPTAPILGTVALGDTLAIEGRSADGAWYRIWWDVDVAGWVSAQYVEADPGAACDHLARGPGVGWTLTFGYDAAALDTAAEILKADGIIPSVTLTSNAGEACRFAQQGYLVNVRPWYALGLSDHPDLTLTPEQSARTRIEALAGYVRLLCADSWNVAIQLTNETTWPSASYLTRWVLEAVRQCDARGWTCLPVVFSTGTPEESWMQTYRPALAALAAGGHYFGYNAYPFQRDLMLCDAAQEWTTWRVLRLRRAAGEPFPRVWLTEAARGAGDVEPIVSDARCFVERTFERQAADVINLWYAGGDSAWSAARWRGEQMIELARALGE